MNPSFPELSPSSSWQEICQIQSDAISTHGKRLGRSLLILEAGCGHSWGLDMTGIDYSLTGVDLDPEALKLRKSQTRDLDVAILGDLCSIELPNESFDVVLSSYVLEHVARADIALRNLMKWLKPGGLLILQLPERTSVQTFYARILPHRCHVWFHRFVIGNKLAGRPGNAPYPTYYHPVIGRERIRSFLAEQGGRVLACYSIGWRTYGARVMNLAVRVVIKLTSIISLGRLTANYNDVLYIAMKQGATSFE